MSDDKKLRIYCYDISDDSSRRKVAKLLEESASRVQYSVFETRQNAKNMYELRDKILPFLTLNDSLRIYTIGRTGERHCEVHGSGPMIEPDAHYWLF